MLPVALLPPPGPFGIWALVVERRKCEAGVLNRGPCAASTIPSERTPMNDWHWPRSSEFDDRNWYRGSAAVRDPARLCSVVA